LLQELHGYTVRVYVNIEDESYPGDSPAIFDAQFVRPDINADMGDTIRVRYFDEATSTAVGEPFSVRAERIVVY
jgi:hypothetical protein